MLKVTVTYVCKDCHEYQEQQAISWPTWSQSRLDPPLDLREVRRMIGDIFELGRQHDGE